MRIKKDLKVRQIVSENVVLLPSKGSDRSVRILSLNPTSYFLWENLCDKDFTVEQAADLLCEKYDVGRETALSDVRNWVDQLQEYGALE